MILGHQHSHASIVRRPAYHPSNMRRWAGVTGGGVDLAGMRRIIVTPILLAGLAGATACGGDPSGPGVASANSGTASPSPPSSAQNPAVSFQHFAACMRQHGQNVPDPDAQGNMTLAPPAGGDAAAWNTAMQGCQHYLPSSIANGTIDQENLAALRAFAVCMRQHGIEASDPDPTNGRVKLGGRLANASRAQIENDPQYQAANDACKDKLVVNGKSDGKNK